MHNHFSRVSLFCLLLTACGGGGGGGPQIVTSTVVVDASASTGELRPLWRDHYDLSYEHFDYAAETGFLGVLADLQPRSLRCSVGRWEVGFPPPPGGDSNNPAILAQINREYYRGPNTLAGADDPLNYDFTYLDALLTKLVAANIEPFLCFDYMPFTLASEQDPANANNANNQLPGTPYSTYSFSNGIRTSPPADPAVYARVVRNVVRHVRGLFAGATDYGVVWFEVGNEPDISLATGAPFPAFWTGTELEFYDMYEAIATEVQNDAAISSGVFLGAGSFAFLPSPAGVMFLQSFVNRVGMNAPRFDFLSFHSYSDDPLAHLDQFSLVQGFANAAGVNVPWVNAEWGRQLGGTDPVYDQIEHGIMRAQTLGLMQIYPFVLAHEALLRNPGTQIGELGLIKTGPPAHKPVSRVYQALNALNSATEAIAVTSNADNLFVIPGRSPALDEVVVALVMNEPGPSTTRRVELTVDQLPWGSGPFSVEVSRVTQGSADSGQATEGVLTDSQSGGELTLQFDVPSGEAGLYLVRAAP